MRLPVHTLSPFLLVPFFVLGLPQMALAQVFFSEIMYDPKGADASGGGEWVEVYNAGQTAVDLTSWFFYENKTNHSIVAEGTVEVPRGGYAVISQDLTAFRSYFVDFSGLLFRASFSLNDGETLALRDKKDAQASDTVYYTSEWGAKNDGESLQKVNGSWESESPTPGSGYMNMEGGVSEDAMSEGEEIQVQNEPANSAPFLVEPQIFADAGGGRIVTTGADTEFNGEARGLTGLPLLGARYVWNFGDGTRKEGKSVFHHYDFPGEYLVVLEISSGEYSAIDRALVSAREARLAVTYAGQDFIVIANYDNQEVNLSWWLLGVEEAVFSLPEHTIILPDREIIIPSVVTGLYPKRVEDVSLMYPNGSVAPLSSDRAAQPYFENKPITHTTSQKKVVGLTLPPAINDTKEDSSEQFDRKPTNEEDINTSSAIKSLPSTSGAIWWSLLGIVTLGVCSALFLRRQSRSNITIID